jgi:hypothetical protein
MDLKYETKGLNTKHKEMISFTSYIVFYFALILSAYFSWTNKVFH